MIEPMERNIRRIRLFLYSKPTGGGSSKYTESILDTPLSRVLNSLKTFVVYTFPEWDQLLAGNPLLKLRNQLEFSKPFSSLLFAVANIASKYSLAYISFWNVFSLNTLCMSGTFLLISIRPRTLRQLRDMNQRNSALALLAFNETFAVAGILLSFRAMERGPVSLVSAVLGSRPIFVAIYALILSRIAPKFIIWSGDKGMLALRLVAIAMIVGGISIIYLT